jgi:nucleoredoxin
MPLLRILLIVACGFTFISTAAPPPMTAKDVALLVRTATPEADIFAEIEKRRLIGAVDEKFASVLKESGATEAFITKLKTGDYSVSAAAAAAAQARASKLQKEAAEDAERRAALKAEAARRSPVAGGLKVPQLVANRLVTFDGSQLRPFDPTRLQPVRIFAFYSSAGWCAPCRKFTPRLVAWYQKIKANHPEFELIFLSADRDAFNMQAYMQSAKMPWPAIKYDARDESLAPFMSKSIPFLHVVDQDGNPVVHDGKGGTNLAPEQVLAALEKALQ